ncbi:hypothetical protein ABZX69_41775 [Streptomyces sp. NPDC004074]|uniref:hypothetical protein n=1 Tax=Streptomyces sp. NPDC004074 TaxID=3154277 RepID=UPI0033AD9711
MSGLCTVLDEAARSATPARIAWSSQSWAALVEQHDMLIRRLGDWPALDVWNADLVVALRAAESQLARLLSARLTSDPTLATADERMWMTLIAENIRRLSQALTVLTASEPAAGSGDREHRRVDRSSSARTAVHRPEEL